MMHDLAKKQTSGFGTNMSVMLLKFSLENRPTLLLHNNIIDWNVDKFHKEANETHDGKTNRCCNCNLLEF
jgi:hypothetical protein